MKIIFKKNFSTLTHEIDVKPNLFGKDLRKLIAEKEDVTPEDVQLKYWGDVIPDDVPVSDYKMKDDDTITYQISNKALNLKKLKVSDEGAEQAASKTITLTLKRQGEQDLKVEVVPEDSIAIVRAKIEEKHNIPAPAIRVKYNNLVMFPAKRLMDYYIDQNVDLELIVDAKIAAEHLAKPKEANAGEKKEEGMKSEARIKAKFHDGDEKELTLDSDETVGTLRARLLKLKPLDKEKENTHRMKVIIGGDEHKDEKKLKDLGLNLKVTINVATVLERVKQDDEVSLVIKRVAGTDSHTAIVKKNSTILDLKKSLEEQFNSKVNEMILKNGEKELQDSQTIEESQLVDSTILTLSVIKKSLFSNN